MPSKVKVDSLGLLSGHDEYDGGGTYIRCLRRTIVLKQGQILVHPGELVSGPRRVRRELLCVLLFYISSQANSLPLSSVAIIKEITSPQALGAWPCASWVCITVVLIPSGLFLLQKIKLSSRTNPSFLSSPSLSAA